MTVPLSPPPVTAVVVCGGEARRFGADKITARLAGRTILDHVLDALPQAWPVIAVGPERPAQRAVLWVRESPPAGGPLAGVLAGARAAGSSLVVVLAGDMPGAGRAAVALVQALTGDASVDAAIASDEEGQLNPLLAAYRVEALLALVPDSGHDRAAKTLLRLAHRAVIVDAWAARDVDTPSDLDRFEREGFR